MIDKFGIYTYKSDLIWFGVENFQNWKHRELTVKKDFLTNSYITKLDAEIFAERPIFTPNIFPMEETTGSEDLEEETEETEPDDSGYDVSSDWELEKWDDLLKRMFDDARTHSFCVVQLYNKAPWWKVFTWREIDKINYDKNDNPIGCHVQWDKELIGSDQWRSHEENLSFYRSERLNNDGTALLVPFGVGKGDDLGEYDLEPLWDLNMYIRYMMLDIVNNSAKTSGFYHYVYGDGIGDAQKQDLLDASDIVGTGQAIGATEQTLKEIRAIFPAKPEFTALALDEALRLYAGIARLPLAFFIGEREAGGFNSGTAGYMDEDKITKKKKYIFGQFVNAIKKLIEMRWGIIIEDVVPFIQAEFDTIELNTEQNNPNFNDNNKNEVKDNA